MRAPITFYYSMPHPTPLQSITLTIIFIFSPLFISLTTSQTHKCSSPPTQISPSSTCPPFSSPLSFPFSSSPCYGHPFFQINCSTPHSTISINNFTFSILAHQPNSTSFLLSPNASFINPFHIPNHPINLSGSPFRFSSNSCSLLSVLQPCSLSKPPTCSFSNWVCELFQTPIRLLHGCEPNQQTLEQGCKVNVLDFLKTFLEMGIQVDWDEDHDTYFSNCKACQTNNGVCGFNSSDPTRPFLCFISQTNPQTPLIRQDNPNRILLLSILFILMCFLFVIAVSMAISKYTEMKLSEDEEDPKSTILFLHRFRSANLLPPMFTYEELESSTNRFDRRRKIGDGGFGSVYLGQLYDGRIVAVKKLHRPQSMAASTKSFCNEILILSSIDHPNLVKLHGYCCDRRGLLLVYDYVPNGTLADHLHGSKNLKGSSLTWEVRLEIALQTAMAIEYLHFSVHPPIVHRDITSSNIFVEKDMRIKVGDFGLSRLLIFSDSSSSSSSGSVSGSGYVWTGPQGTPGYLDPDYHKSFRLTEKSDLYSFGVVLLELISGMKAVDLGREKREMALADLMVSKIQLGSLHQVVDPVLMLEEEVMRSVDAVAELAFRCVAADKDDRPDAKEVVQELKRIRSRTRGHRDLKELQGL